MLHDAHRLIPQQVALRLTSALSIQVADVCAEYDDDDDKRLDAKEAMVLVRDIWRLVLASR